MLQGVFFILLLNSIQQVNFKISQSNFLYSLDFKLNQIRVILTLPN
jgi:hypothetical protein